MIGNCEVCGEIVDQSLAGRTVGGGGKVWHGKCYKTQEQMDHYKACWDTCVGRLKVSAAEIARLTAALSTARNDAMPELTAPKVKPLVWEQTRFGWVSGPYEVWGDDDDAMVRMNDRQFRHTGGKAAAQAHHDALIQSALVTQGEE
mgnify:CR=1 FL=1